MTGFAELGARSNFSFLDGASHPEELVETAQALGLAGLGICDSNSLAGVVRGHVAAKTHPFQGLLAWAKTRAVATWARATAAST
jgi:DNA polymerase III alpha subunit